MYAQEQYVDTPPTVEALRFTVQQYLRMRGSTCPETFPVSPQQQLQQPAPANQQNQLPAPTAQAPPNAQQIPQQPAAFRQQPQRTCFNCGDPSHFVADCPVKDRARKPIQQVVNSCRTNMTGEWVCPSNPRGMNDNITPAALPEQGIILYQLRPRGSCDLWLHDARKCSHRRTNTGGVVRPYHEFTRPCRHWGPNTGTINIRRRRPLTSGSSDLWRKTNSHHAGTPSTQLHRNAYIHPLAIIRRAKGTPRPHTGPTERGTVAQHKPHNSLETPATLYQKWRDQASSSTKGQNNRASPHSNHDWQSGHAIWCDRSPGRTFPSRPIPEQTRTALL